MWFKLNTTFTQSLGTLDSLSNSWSITRNLTNFSTTSTTTSVTKNGSYSATFTLNSGCTYSSHSVTMGGATVTSGISYSNGTLTVNISKVTGAVVITATATGASSGGGNNDSGGGNGGGNGDSGGESGTNITSRFVFTTLGPIVSTTGEQNTANTSSYGSDYADVSGFKTITIAQLSTPSNTSTNGLAFYDANKIYISGQPQILGDTTTSYGIRTIDVPSNAKYCRTTWFKPTSGTNESTGGWKGNAAMVDVEFSCFGNS